MAGAPWQGIGQGAEEAGGLGAGEGQLITQHPRDPTWTLLLRLPAAADTARSLRCSENATVPCTTNSAGGVRARARRAVCDRPPVRAVVIAIVEGLWWREYI